MHAHHPVASRPDDLRPAVFLRTFLWAALLLLPALSAQRENKVFKTRGGQVVLSYGVVIVGKHGIHELQQGTSWRMGQGDASTLATQLPLISGSGDLVVPPGTYQAQIYRATERDLRLTLGQSGAFGRGGGRGGAGGGRGQGGGDRGGGGAGGGGPITGGGDTGRRDAGGRDAGGRGARGGDGFGGFGRGGRGLQLPGVLHEAKKPTKKLQIDWVATKTSKQSPVKATEGAKNTTLQIDFGRHGLLVPIRVVQAKTQPVKKFLSLGFTYPLDLFERRLENGDVTAALTLVPRAKQKKGAPLIGFNVMITKDRATVVPIPTPPQARGGRGGFGGGGGAGPGGRGGRRGGGRAGAGGDAADVTPAPERSGSIEWVPFQSTDKAETVVIRSIKAQKKSLRFEIVAGDRLGKVEVPLPELPKKK